MLIPLNVKSNYSLLSSLISIPKLIKYAKDNNLKELVLCDNNMFATIYFINMCKENNIKPVIGLEIKYDNKCFNLYAKNYEGYKSLMKLSTILTERELSINDLTNYKKDLIIVVPFKNKDYLNILDFYNEKYLGFTTKTELQESYMVTRDVVYFPEILYLNEDEKDIYKYLTMMRDNKTITDEIKFNSKNNHLYSDYKNISDNLGIENITVIIKKCNLEFPKFNMILPAYTNDSNLSPDDYLYNLSIKGLLKRFNQEVDDNYKQRLLYELSIIKQMGFSNYFLVVYDFINYAKKNKILVGPGRGSAAGSLVAFSLGITEIDPIKYDLLFERFLNPERITMPDIDTDFPDIYRDQVIDYVKEKYGHKKVASIITFGTMALKQTIRDTSRVLNIPLYKVDNLCKYISFSNKVSLRETYETNEKFRLYIDEDSTLTNMFKIALNYENFPRHTSTHAAGIVIGSEDLDETIPLVKNNNDYLTSYSMEYLEQLGLIKMDFLGITNLTTIMNIIKDVEIKENKIIDFNTIDLDDPKVLELFSSANTNGIFQFESTGMKKFLKKLKPNTIDDLFAAIALFRPGPSNNIDSYIKRKNKQEEVKYLHQNLENILKNTYGIIIYQEQIMQIAVLVAGYSLGEADLLRRAMSKKKYELLKNEEDKFITQSIQRGYSKEISTEIFNLILQFANYGFNKAHSVAYTMIAYKMAYLKRYYPQYFYASLMTSVTGNETKINEYLKEARQMNINILKPDVNKSSKDFCVTKEGIRFPITSIKNVGLTLLNDILKYKKEDFKDIFDFLGKVNGRSLTKKAFEALIDGSFFDSFNINHKTLQDNIDLLINYAELAKDINPDYILKPDINFKEEYSKEELLLREKEVFGFYFSNHPSFYYRIEYPKTILVKDISNYFGKTIDLIVMIDKMSLHETKNKDKMAFLSCSDESGEIDVIVFPKELKNYDLNKGKNILLTASVEKRFDSFQLVAKMIKYL